MNNDVIIRADGVWKRYGLPFSLSFREKMSSLMKPSDESQNEHDIWALKDINFELKRGEVLGIIGRNGAGKSTLLKMLAGVTPPSRGKLEVYGRIFPMIELGAGMNSELTGRQNTRLLGAIMGLMPRQIEAKMAAIEEFCELEDWFDRPVRKYSSGMIARLGFGVALNVDADILLVDEVLSVGDITFARKSLQRMEELHRSGCSVIFVSHSIRQVERLCDRTLLLEKGEQLVLGETSKAVTTYYELSSDIVNQAQQVGGKTILQQQIEDPIIEVTNIRLLNQYREECHTFETGAPMIIRMEYKAHSPVEDAIVSFGFTTIDSLDISGFTNETPNSSLPTLQGEGIVECVVKKLILLSGIYSVRFKVKNKWEMVLGMGYGFSTFTVNVPEEIRLAHNHGLVYMDVEWLNN